ncbi:MAG TPA: FAD-dependent oxidoreductase [Bacteroidia bacterium]|nr:FAD-dependent oxidoreductase [Bacteroidia bacterium]
MRILIAGQGLAGSILAFSLLRKGVDVLVVDQGQELISSRIAAGILRPVTGRRMVKTANADNVVPFAFEFYDWIATQTGINSFYRKDSLQLFASASSRNDWYVRSEDPGYPHYIGAFISEAEIDDSLNSPFGGVILKQCGYLDTNAFLNGCREKLMQIGSYQSGFVDWQTVSGNSKSLQWENKKFDRVVFCEGVAFSDLFRFVQFKPVKGELFEFYAPELNEDRIIQSGNFILPLGNGKFRAGATYDWTNLNTDKTTEARELITNWIAKTIRVPFEITGHAAGIRPATVDRRPAIGFHQSYPRLALFNGLGSKGVMLAPFYGAQLANAILEQGNIDSDCDLNRFA